MTSALGPLCIMELQQRETWNYSTKGFMVTLKVNKLVWLHNPIILNGHSRKLYCHGFGTFHIQMKLLVVNYGIANTQPTSHKDVHNN